MLIEGKNGDAGAPEYSDPQACHLLTVREGVQQEGAPGQTYQDHSQRKSPSYSFQVSFSYSLFVLLCPFLQTGFRFFLY